MMKILRPVLLVVMYFALSTPQPVQAQECEDPGECENFCHDYCQERLLLVESLWCCGIPPQPQTCACICEGEPPCDPGVCQDYCEGPG